MEEDKSGTEIEKQLQSLLTRSTELEQKARRRASYFVIIPVALAFILLMGTGLQMRASQQEVAVVEEKLGLVQDDLLSTRLQLDNTKEDLAAANDQADGARAELTETLVTLENVTGNLVEAQNRLARSDADMKVLQGEIAGLQDKVRAYNEEIVNLNKQIEDLQKSLDSVRDELQAATDLKRYNFTGDWLPALKYIEIAYPAAGELFQSIVENQDVPWFNGGFSVNQGFDSPGFAAHILELNERLVLSNPADRYNLSTLLSVRRGTPVVGDIVFYEGGYTMFYFIDETGVPFVIGMTSQGVLALAPDFAPVSGYATP